MKYLVDLSVYQNSIGQATWQSIKDKCCGVILRIGYRGYGTAGNIKADTAYTTHLNNATKHNIPVGVYFFSQAINAAEGREEAAWVASHFDIVHSPFPIYIDTEWANNTHTGRADKISKADRTAAVKAFCEQINTMGGRAGIYASTSWFNSQLDMSQLQGYSIWRAHYTNTDKFSGKTEDIWQYSSNNALGIACVNRLDCNKVFKDFVTDTNVGNKPVPDLGTFVLKRTIGSNFVYNKYVANLQNALNTLGYPCGTADGKFGAATEKSVKTFQSCHGLVVDGKVGNATKAKIKAVW